MPVFVSIHRPIASIPCRQALERLQAAKRSRSTFTSANVHALEQEVVRLQDYVNVVTEVLGEGKTSEGWVADVGPRGVAVRCALAMKNARGKDPDPNHASASGVACGHCVHDTPTGECHVTQHLALCYYCMQPLCRKHRVLIAGGRFKQGQATGGATCTCQDRDACTTRTLAVGRILAEGDDAPIGKRRRVMSVEGTSASGALASGASGAGGSCGGRGGWQSGWNRGGWWQQGGTGWQQKGWRGGW